MMVMERRGLLDRIGLNQQVAAKAFSKTPLFPPTFPLKGRDFFYSQRVWFLKIPENVTIRRLMKCLPQPF